MAELRSLLKDGEDVALYAISVDPPETSRELARKIEADGKGPVRFTLLSDPGSRTVDAYGLRDPAYADQPVDGIPHPAVYVIDPEGKVRWARVESDYRQRPSNADIRSALTDLKGR